MESIQKLFQNLDSFLATNPERENITTELAVFKDTISNSTFNHRESFKMPKSLSDKLDKLDNTDGIISKIRTEVSMKAISAAESALEELSASTPPPATPPRMNPYMTQDKADSIKHELEEARETMEELEAAPPEDGGESNDLRDYIR